MSWIRVHVGLVVLLVLAGCAGAPKVRKDVPALPSPVPSPVPAPQAKVPAPPATTPRRGGYYEDDGPGETIPPGLERTPDAVVRDEPPHRYANSPYEVFGERYAPISANTPYRAQGVASWYGRKFHGKATASGEIYDMFQMTAAHPILSIPSYVRVTNVSNGKSVVVRVNDRGPFHSDRIIDLSYTAALKLGFVDRGSTQVQVELLRSQDQAIATGARVASTMQTANIPARAATALPETRDRQGIFLQLAAFGSQASAERFRLYLEQRMAGLAQSTNVLQQGGLFRVRAGPYVSRGEAKSAAQRIGQRLQLDPIVSAN